MFQKKLADMSFDVIDVLIGFDSAECQMRVGPYQFVCYKSCIYWDRSFAVYYMYMNKDNLCVTDCLQNLIESLNKFLSESYPG